MRKNYLTILAPLLGFFGAVLRYCNLIFAFDSDGLPIAGSWTTNLLIGLIFVSAVIFLLFSIGFRPAESDESVMCLSRPGAQLAITAALLIAIGCVLTCYKDFMAVKRFTAIVDVLGVFAGLCLVLTALQRKNSRPTSPLPELIPIIYLLLRLIFSFKEWSTDPIILDYFVLLCAVIFILLATYYSAGFAFNESRPKRTLFFSLMAVFFSFTAFADGLHSRSAGDAIFFLGFMLWMLAVSLTLAGAEEAPDDYDEDDEYEEDEEYDEDDEYDEYDEYEEYED